MDQSAQETSAVAGCPCLSCNISLSTLSMTFCPFSCSLLMSPESALPNIEVVLQILPGPFSAWRLYNFMPYKFHQISYASQSQTKAAVKCSVCFSPQSRKCSQAGLTCLCLGCQCEANPEADRFKNQKASKSCTKATKGLLEYKSRAFHGWWKPVCQSPGSWEPLRRFLLICLQHIYKSSHKKLTCHNILQLFSMEVSSTWSKNNSRQNNAHMTHMTHNSSQSAQEFTFWGKFRI